MQFDLSGVTFDVDGNALAEKIAHNETFLRIMAQRLANDSRLASAIANAIAPQERAIAAAAAAQVATARASRKK
jgi:hypothetical protein